MSKKAIFMFVFVITLALFPQKPTDAKSRLIDDYITASFDTEHTTVAFSKDQFESLCKANKTPITVIEHIDGNSDGNTEVIRAKRDGCLLISAMGHDSFLISAWDTYDDYSYCVHEKTIKEQNLIMVPIEAGHTYLIEKQLNYPQDSLLELSIGFIPNKRSYSFEKIETKADGSIRLLLNDEYNHDTELVAVAVHGYYSSSEVYTTKIQYTCGSVFTDNGAELTLPEKGIYTIRILTILDNQIVDYQVLHFDSDEYTNVPKPEEPYSALSDTNVIVGKARPDAEVIVKYNNLKYSAIASWNGIYKIRLEDTLTTGQTIVLYQKWNGITSKKTRTFVTDD